MNAVQYVIISYAYMLCTYTYYFTAVTVTPLINTGLSRYSLFPPSQEDTDIRWVSGASDATSQKPITSQQQQQQQHSTVDRDIDYNDAHCHLLERLVSCNAPARLHII